MSKKIALLITLLMAAMPLHAQEPSDYIKTTAGASEANTPN
jgi:hypothetical protein